MLELSALLDFVVRTTVACVTLYRSNGNFAIVAVFGDFEDNSVVACWTTYRRCFKDFTRWVMILHCPQSASGSQIGQTCQCHGKITTFGEAFSCPVLINGIREAREVLHVPVPDLELSS